MNSIRTKPDVSTVDRNTGLVRELGRADDIALVVGTVIGSGIYLVPRAYCHTVATYVIFTAWIFYGLTVASVIVLRVRRPDLERSFRVPAYPWLPTLFVFAALGISVNTIVGDPIHACFGIAMILAGVPLYLFFRTTEKSAETDLEAIS